MGMGHLVLQAVAFFGTGIDPSCNLHWRAHKHPIVGLGVALFPALDTLSVFPMNVSFLANNLMAVVLGQEFSGVVEKVGGKVTKFKEGDAVLGHKVIQLDHNCVLH